MKKINDGGPAFPDADGQINYTGGMTLRDYFAIHYPGIHSDCDHKYLTMCYPELGTLPNFTDNPIENAYWWSKADCLCRYKFADDMLKAREVNHGKN